MLLGNLLSKETISNWILLILEYAQTRFIKFESENVIWVGYIDKEVAL